MATIKPSEPEYPDERPSRTYNNPIAPWQTWPLLMFGAGIILILAMVALI